MNQLSATMTTTTTTTSTTSHGIEDEDDVERAQSRVVEEN